MSRAALMSAVRMLLFIAVSLLFLMSLLDLLVEFSTSISVEYNLTSLTVDVVLDVPKMRNAATMSASTAPIPTNMNFFSSGFLAGAAIWSR